MQASPSSANRKGASTQVFPGKEAMRMGVEQGGGMGPSRNMVSSRVGMLNGGNGNERQDDRQGKTAQPDRQFYLTLHIATREKMATLASIPSANDTQHDSER